MGERALSGESTKTTQRALDDAQAALKREAEAQVARRDQPDDLPGACPRQFLLLHQIERLLIGEARDAQY